jgi:Zn-dependent peptidase ImmA (M78 family)
MKLDGLEQEALDLFWHLCGEEETFPRSLERPLALALPVALVKLPRLRLWDIERWIQQRGNNFIFGCESRSARGCLIAQSGQGVLFVDGSDPADEQRVTIAHEIAHFLCDYWLPRRTAISKFGLTIAEALDGLRPLTVTERVHALLSDTKVGPYQSLMERSESANSDHIWKAENRADRFALALLAPSQAVFPLLDFLSESYPVRLQKTKEVLCRSFGLPVTVAAGYASSLLAEIGKGPSWVESLGLR